jgi:hypothetical protein
LRGFFTSQTYTVRTDLHERLHLPRYIAFCGVPKSGKSLAQEILLENYGVQPVDDGAILREFAMKNLGATYDQVHTQEGKASLAFWPNGDPMIDARNGEHMTWRRVLGLLGNQLEAMFGKYVMPMTACARVAKQPGPFSFGSVRRDQGAYYQHNGGIIIEIVNPLAQADRQRVRRIRRLDRATTSSERRAGPRLQSCQRPARPRGEDPPDRARVHDRQGRLT